MDLTGIHAVVFDLDGTLVEFRIDYLSVRREAIEKINQIDEFPKNIFSTEMSIFKMLEEISTYLREKSNSDMTIIRLKKDLFEIANKYEMDAARTTRMLPGVAEVLEKVRSQGYKVGLFTTSGIKAMSHILDRFRLTKYFDACVSRDEAPKIKPHPSHLGYTIEILGVKPEQTLVVGDTIYDIISAKAVGVPSIGVLTGVHTGSQLEDAGVNYIISTLHELPRLINQINSELS